MAYFHTLLNFVGVMATIESRSGGFCPVIYSFGHSQSACATCGDRVALCTRSPRLAAVACCSLRPARLLHCARGPLAEREAVSRRVQLRWRFPLVVDDTWRGVMTGRKGRKNRNNGAHALLGRGGVNEILQEMSFSSGHTWQLQALIWLLYKKPCMFL